MDLIALEIRSFKNISHVILHDLERITVIAGPNGAGKTNLLEAIHATRMGRLLKGKSWRTAVMRGRSSFLIRSRENDMGAAHTYAFAYDLVAGRRLALDGEPVDTKGFLTRRPALFFGPDSSATLLASPGERRTLLDSMVFALWPSYYDVAAGFKALLRRRQAVLKSGDGRILDSLDPMFAQAAARVDQGRAAVVERILPHLGALWSRLRPDGGSVSVSYQTHTPEAYMEALSKARRTDLRRGYTSVGPHRKDVSITIEGVPLRDAVSRGEAKLLTLALLLSFAKVLMHKEVAPLLLVDDLPSELDSSSLALAWAAITQTGAQVVATTLDPAFLGGQARVVKLSGGAVVS